MKRLLALVSLAVVAPPFAGGLFGMASATGAAVPHASVLRDGTVQQSPGSSSTGYATKVANETSAEGTFVLPKFTCTGAQNFELSVQLEGPPSAADGFVTVICRASGAAPAFEAVACAGSTELCGGTTFFPFSGDTITITDTMTASQASSTVDDVTAQKVSTTTGAGSSTTTNSNFIEERESRTIPTFKKTKFTNCTVNGTPISANAAEAFGPMRGARDTTQVKSSPLNSEGNGFTTIFKNA